MHAPKIARIAGRIEYPDGTSHEFALNEHGWQQWGETPSVLTQRGTSELLTRLAEAADGWILSPHDEEPPTRSPYTVEDFANALRSAEETADADSNDDEIDALWETIEIAASLLGVQSEETQ